MKLWKTDRQKVTLHGFDSSTPVFLSISYIFAIKIAW